jgi:hypothetical protein
MGNAPEGERAIGGDRWLAIGGLTAPGPDDRYETEFPLYDLHDNLPG